MRSSTARSALAFLALLLAAATAQAELPRPVARAFLDAGVPLTHVAVLVQRAGARRPLFAHQPDEPMNPASTMKLVTTFAALELLGPDYRWQTEAYLDGPLVDGTLHGNLVLKGHGDPRITVEQWQAFIEDMRAKGLDRIEGDLVLDRSHFALPAHDPAAFDAEPLRPYNVGPDALLVNFKTVRFAFSPNAAGDAVDVQVDPPLPQIALGTPPALVDGDCGNWRRAVAGTFVNEPGAAAAAFPGRYPRGCGARDWNVALLDHPAYVHGMFAAYFAASGGSFHGGAREGRPPPTTAFAVLESAPLRDVIRDINKLSNNVMARQLFLTLATASAPPPATLEGARDAVGHWLAARKLAMPGLRIDNGSGLSREERVTARGLANVLAAALASPARDDFVPSLAVAATDGTLERRMRNGRAAGRARLKTGSLDGVRALAGYLRDAGDAQWIVVAMINHPNAARAQGALDYLVDWTLSNAAAYTVRRH